MAKVISQFFSDLGFPLRNIRWSWGARSGDTMLLRTWADEYSGKERKVTVLREPTVHQLSDSFGLDERIVQLKAIWEGGVAAYTVIATVKDKDARPREIKEYRDDAVFAIKQLEVRPDGSTAAVLSELVPLGALTEHALTHRTAAGEGPFPIDDTQRSGLSTDSYQQKIPAIRSWLVEACHARGTVTYSDVMNRFGLTFYPLRNAMSRLGDDCKNAGEPIITALIVDKDTHRCSEGLFDEFGIDDDVAERERCYAYWAAGGNRAVPPLAPMPPVTNEVDDFEQRAARFAQVEVRTQQGAFRNAVFRACGGSCVVSGCAVPEALEAAHLLGRDWRQGHNSAGDGILLRRDLHTLYDRGLLLISGDGWVELDSTVREYYAEFNGAAVAGKAEC
jgi:hypothetical protein